MRGTIPGLVNPHPLVTALPSLYQGSSFTERFLSAFDDLLAPLFTTLGTVDAYLDPRLAPADFLPWLAGWVGIELDENWSEEQQRRLIAEGVSLLQWRGTRRGLVDLIGNYLGVEETAVVVEDSGGVAWSATPNGPLPGSGVPTVLVRVAGTDGEVDLARLERVVESAVPAHVAPTVEVEHS